MSEDQTTEDEIHNWLKRKPVPRLVRVECATGETKTVTPPPNRRLRNWAETIDGLEPVMLEALDGDGNILRVFRVGESVAVRVAAPFDPMAPPPPVNIPDVLKTDPSAGMIMFVADLLYRSQSTQAQAQGETFGRLCDLLERSERRQDQTEERLERVESAYRSELLANMRNMAAQSVAQDENGGDAIVQAFLSGAQSRQRPPAVDEVLRRAGKGWGFSPDQEEPE